MDPRALKRWGLRALTLLGCGAGVWALLLLAHSAEKSADFNRRLLWILLLNIGALLVLGVLLARKLYQLYRDFRDHVPGSRLTARTVGMFGTLVVVPLLIVYLFALEFLNYGIDSWFRIDVKQGLNDALELSRSALELRLREQSRRTENFAHAIAALTGPDLAVRLDAERRATQAADVSVYDAGGRVLTFSSANPTAGLPAPLPAEVRLQLAAHHSYFALQPPTAGRATIVTAAPLARAARVAPGRFVVINYELPAKLSALADAVQSAYSNYGDTSATREPLKINFIMTLTLVLLITMLAAVYGAVWSAQRLTRPVKDLIAGTRAVGKGDFGTRLPLPSRDEMGFLVHSFNDMTKRLRRTSEEARLGRQAVERERERLAVILSRLSSGVLVVDAQLQLRSANPSAGAILGGDLVAMAGRSLAAISGAAPLLTEFVGALRARLGAGRREWREQLTLKDEAGNRVLLWACTPLPDASDEPGLVIVFEDVTALLTAQRNAAWGEVARRLAHEIKNPLTPIQLSAEQLRRKLLPGLDTEHARLLERGTHTIVQQVDAMKQMVNAFSDYARAPEVQLAQFSLNQLTAEMVELYRLQDPGVSIVMELDPQLPEIEADRGRVRQILANLLSNGIEAVAGVASAAITVRTRWLRTLKPAQAEITVSDNGPGFREDILQRAFDPYVTSKARGTGLGLAIVQRIVEEHGGRISAENLATGGARIRVLLPATAGRRTELRRERA
ncbi:MAG: HAMP domain-containing protein [Gammaproteobacteria bacterium]|nr:HAMP domain-containing protein [Gammaproteobacteria bacterium]